MKAIINMNPHLTKQKIVGAILVFSVAVSYFFLSAGASIWMDIIQFILIVLGVLLYTNFFKLNTCNIILQPKSIVVKWKGKFKADWIHFNYVKSWGMNEQELYIETNLTKKSYSLGFLSEKRKEALKEALTQYASYIDKEFGS
ncbi:MAG: hypothetical protein ACPGSG_06925 [Prolixibacteraceae bacterium]|jgi:hypothetical protein|nr:hypothetical protein [Prolixibacteraceae bacterium]